MTYLTSVKLEGEKETWEGSVLNISSDGMFLETLQNFAIGDRVNVTFRMRHSGHTVDMAIEIKRTTPEGIGAKIIWP